MAKPKFYLEPRPGVDQAINMFYSFGGKRLQYYTGIRVEIKNFRSECNTSNSINPIKSTAPFAAAYNNKLKSMAVDAVSIVSETKGDNLTVSYVRARLDAIYKPKPETVEAEISEAPITFIAFFEKLL
jgi:hypothetical protein